MTFLNMPSVLNIQKLTKPINPRSSKRRWIICWPGLYNLQNGLTAKKVLNSWDWSFHQWQYWMASNKDNAQACEHAQNMLHKLRVQLIQFTNQQKVAKKLANSWN